MDKSQIQDIYNLSPMQEGMLFHLLAEPNSEAYFEQVNCTLEGTIDLPKFKQAWQDIVDHYAVFRTSFHWDGLDKPLQVVHKTAQLPWETLDWTHLNESEQQEQFEALLLEDRKKGFKHEQAPLMRCTLVRSSASTSKFIWSHHHMLMDGWCGGLVLSELFERYASSLKNTRVPFKSTPPFKNYISWLGQQDMQKATDFWAKELAGFEAPTSLGIGNASALSKQHSATQYAEFACDLNQETANRLTDFAKEIGVTLNVVVQGVWSILLSKYSGEKDIVFGSTVSGRPAVLKGVESIVGLFINSLPVRVGVEANTDIISWLKALQNANNERNDFAYTPLVEIKKASPISGTSPLFNSLLVFENYPFDGSSEQGLHGLTISNVASFEETNYPLTIMVIPRGGKLRFQLNYFKYAFRSEEVERVFKHIETAIQSLIANPAQSPAQVTILSNVERETVLLGFNSSAVAYPKDKTVIDLFQSAVRATPQAPALVFGEETVSYQELDQRANDLRNRLLAKGVQKGDVVAIIQDRNTDLIASLLGTLKAGASFLPIDTTTPEERVMSLLQDAEVKTAVASKDVFESLSQKAGLTLIDPAAIETNGANSIVPLDCIPSPSDTAYIIYTSGSTGKPKGVKINHGSLFNYLSWSHDTYFEHNTSGGNFPLFTSPAFDLTLSSIFIPLTKGKTIEIYGDQEVGLTMETVFGTEGKLDTVKLTPSHITLLKDIPVGNTALKTLIVGGEALHKEHLETIEERWPQVVVFNEYGPTEATIGCTAGVVSSKNNNIGKPIANTSIYILDEYLEPVAIGVKGELFIGGDCLSQGYLRQAEQTALRFIDSPFEAGKKIYRTGDVACWLGDGSLNYFGRNDDQVKVRGYRIEVGEIESHLLQFVGIDNAAVLPVANNSGELNLVAFLKTGDAFDLVALKATLQQQLPQYMLPAHYDLLQDFPLTANGKTNKKALLKQYTHFVGTASNYKAPKNPIEGILASIWAEILGIELVGTTDNFFELGGHSLNATQMTSRIRVAFKADISVKDVLENQTIEELAEAIGKLKLDKETGFSLQPIVPVSAGERTQLSYAQQRLWFLSRLEGATATYNIPETIHIEGDLEKEALENAFSTIVARHEILRTNFFERDGVAFQEVQQAAHFSIPTVETALDIDQLIEEESVKTFDLESDMLIRAVLFKVADQEHYLSVTMHHIISDGWSASVFVNELIAFYEASISGHAISLSSLPVQYGDYAAWQRELGTNGVFEAQLSYWKNKLSGAPFVLDLPTDKPRPNERTEHGNVLRFSIDEALSAKLRTLSSTSGATMFMTLLSAYSVLLSRYSRQHELLIGSSIANRNRMETEALIGFFINVIVYRIDVAKADNFLALIDQVKRLAFEAYAHQDVPFDLVLDELKPERSMSYTPVFQVAFDMQNMPMPTLEISGLRIAPKTIERPVAKYDLSLSMEDNGGTLQGVLEYNTDLFTVPTMERLAEQYIFLLEKIVENPKQQLNKLPLVGKEQFNKMIYDWNATEVTLPINTTVLDVVADQANEAPHQTAFEFDGEVISYSRLETESYRIACRLLAEGLTSGERVAVIANRSKRLLSVVLGIMKAGGVYVPVDPEYPTDRVNYMLQDAEVQLLMSDGTEATKYPIKHINSADDALYTVPASAAQPLPGFISPEALAYIIYTSGSTGTPKGVMIRHKSLLNLSLEQGKAFKVKSNSRTLQFASLSFDASISEIFVSLCAGSTLIMAPKAKMLPGPDLLDVFQSARISHVTLPPSILQALPYTALPLLTTLVVAGEACDPSLLDVWAVNRTFINAYGPTEYTVCATLKECAVGDKELSIGRPIGNTVAYILDENLLPVPPGVPGELFIGGVGVAAGYVNLPELTEERFIKDPFSKNSNASMYRTGDLSKYLPDGNICFLGRTDRQVKLRGFRIEPGEIEAVLKEHPSVEQSVVQVQESENGHQKLVGFVTLKEETAAEVSKKDEWAESPMELWPSVAEFYVYDEFLYYAMTNDERRNDAYKKALVASVKDKVVVEIGTGKDAILSRFCVEAGAAKVYAVELNENTAKLARASVELAGYSDKITVVHGDASQVELPELGDVCVSEIVGAIGGSEGSAVIINNSRRLLKDGGKMIPERSNTMMAAVTLPDEIHKNPGFNKVPGHYTKAIFDQVGYPFDLRLCVKKFPNDHLLSTKDIFEDLDYTKHIELETEHNFRFEIFKKGRLDGILVWLNLQTMEGVVIDILEHEYCWLPVFLPVFNPGVAVDEGDYITGVCTRTLCENGLNPDFLLEGKLVKTNGEEVLFTYNAWHNKEVFKQNPFYETLFEHNTYGLLPQSLDGAQVGVEDFLQDKLPSYLLPNSIVVVDEIPLTMNGKIDRRKLNSIALGTKKKLDDHTAPQTVAEKTLASIWEDVLGIENVGIHHNFFKLGGDSILSIQIVSRARVAGLEFTPKDLFENQTIAELAEVAKEKTKTTAEQGILTGVSELSAIQSWFFEQEFAFPDHFNQSVLLSTDSATDLAELQQVIEKLVEHHDALRTKYSWNEATQQWTQEILSEAPSTTLSVHDVSAYSEANREEVFLRIANNIQAGLSLAKGNIFEAAFFNFGNGQPSRLLFVAHHLCIDGVSWRILLEDFLQGVTNFAAWQLPEKTHSYHHWIKAMSAHAKKGIAAEEIAYWQKVASIKVAPIPRDTVSQKSGSGMITVTLAADKTDVLLKEVSSTYRTHIQEVLLAGFIRTINEWTGETTALIELESHGREELFEGVDISRTAGWFTAAYPALFELPKGIGVESTIQSIKEQFRSIPNKGVGYGMLRYLSDQQERFAMQQAPEILFNYLGQSDAVIKSDNQWSFANADSGFDQSPNNHRVHPLGVNIIILKGQLNISIGYDDCMHSAATIDALAQSFLNNLKAMIDHCKESGATQLSPSDFPIARIDNAALSVLSAQIKNAGHALPNVSDIYPLSPLQHGLLFQTLLHPQSVAYREQLSVTLKGNLNTGLFKQAWKNVIAKYDILRTAFLWDELEQPMQVVLNEVGIQWDEQSWTSRSAENSNASIKQFLKQDMATPFAFEKAPLMRFTLRQLPDNNYFFCWTHHHILMDGWCLPIIVREVFDNYEGLAAGEVLRSTPVKPYKNFIKWLNSKDENEATAWWTNYLKGIQNSTPIATDFFNAKESNDHTMGECGIELDAALENKLKQFSKDEGVTLNILVHAAWSFLVSRYTGNEDVIFGATVAGRPPELDGVEKMVGLFINSVPVRTQVDNTKQVGEWLQELQTAQLERDNYTYTSLAKISECAGLEGSQALFDSLIIFENYPLDKSVDSGLKGISIEEVDFVEQTHYPITLMVVPGEALTFKISYNDSKFAAASIERMLQHLQQIVSSFTAGKAQTLGEISMTSEQEMQTLLGNSSSGAPIVDVIEPMVHRFVAQANAEPQAIALQFEQENYTYEEINLRSNQLANHIVGEGFNKGDLVAVCLDRSPELIIALLAIMKAGGAYLPLDPSFPAERLNYMIKDAKASFILTESKYRELWQTQGELLVLEDAKTAIAKCGFEPLNTQVQNSDLAYVIYTSGSTGQPKGVMVSHGALGNFLASMEQKPGIGSEDVLLAVTTVSFDIAGLEIFLPLVSGATLALLVDEVAGDPVQLIAAIENIQPTIMQATPTTWQMLVKNGWDGNENLKVLSGGEATPNALAEVLVEQNQSLWNMYGPTETTIWSGALQIDTEKHLGANGYLKVGGAIANTNLYVLDEHLTPVPAGVAGEVYIGGKGLAQGYLGRAELTAERFVNDPFSEKTNRNMYRTGDLAKWTADGTLLFLGRLDHQVKVRGFRIEVGEIESLMKAMSGIAEAVVTAGKDHQQNDCLLGYVELKEGHSIAAAEIGNALRTKLPNYMIPSLFTFLESMPTTPNGKTDRKALVPNWGNQTTTQAQYQAPVNELQKAVHAIWCDVLGHAQISITDNFFSIGGHSLLATQCISRVRHEFEVDFPLKQLFDHPDIASFAIALQTVIDLEKQTQYNEIEQLENDLGNDVFEF